jgi:hypothetical protein
MDEVGVNPHYTKMVALLAKIKAHHDSQERPNTTQYELLGTQVIEVFRAKGGSVPLAEFYEHLRHGLEERIKLESLDVLLKE